MASKLIVLLVIVGLVSAHPRPQDEDADNVVETDIDSLKEAIALELQKDEEDPNNVVDAIKGLLTNIANVETSDRLNANDVVIVQYVEEPLIEEGSGQEVDYSGDEDEESNVDATDTRSGTTASTSTTTTISTTTTATTTTTTRKTTTRRTTRPTTTTTTSAPPSAPPGYLARFVNFASRSVNAVGSNIVGTGALLLAAASPLIVPAFAGKKRRKRSSSAGAGGWDLSDVDQRTIHRHYEKVEQICRSIIEPPPPPPKCQCGDTAEKAKEDETAVAEDLVEEEDEEEEEDRDNDVEDVEEMSN